MSTHAARPFFLPRRFAIGLAIASLVNVLPALLFTLGGDMVFHRILADCFAGQLWQGELYPRWCPNANAGLGSPAFIFYFPLAYYIQALLWPLGQVGVSPQLVYTLGMFLATYATGMAVYAWLSDVVSPGRAMLAAILFLFLPYRMEVMFFRTGYAEAWSMAFAPLVFKYVRRLARGQPRALPMLAASAALLILTHVPAAAIMLPAAALYLLLSAPVRWRLWAAFAGAMLWAAGLAAFYLVPAQFFRRFMAPPEQTQISTMWANTFLSMNNFKEQPQVAIAISAAILALTALCAHAFFRRRRLPEPADRQELTTWIILSLLAVLLLLPVTAPLYRLAGPLALFSFPWRMQGLYGLGIAYLLAAHMQWLVTGRQLRTWRVDFGALLALLVLLSYFVLGIATPESEAAAERLMNGKVATELEYRTLWTPRMTFTKQAILARAEGPKTLQASLAHGKGRVTVEQWGSSTLLSTESDLPIAVRAAQYYLPIWRAENARGDPLAVRPDPGTGLIAIETPPGKHIISLRRHIAWARPNLILSAYGLSIAGWIALAAALRGRPWRRRQTA